MDTEQSMKQNSEISLELRCREAKNSIFCKILHIFSNSAQLTKFFEKFCDCRIAEFWQDCKNLVTFSKNWVTFSLNWVTFNENWVKFSLNWVTFGLKFGDMWFKLDQIF